MKGQVTFDGVRSASTSLSEARSRLDELVIAWAADRPTGAAKYILEVDRGLACDCVCPACGSALTAVNSRNPRWRKRPHSRHPPGAVTEACAVLAARHALLQALKDAEGPSGATFQLPGRTRNALVTGLSGAHYSGSATAPPLRLLPEAVRLLDSHSALIRLDDGREVLVQVVASLERQADLPVEHRAVIQVVASEGEMASLASLSPDDIRVRLRLLLEDGQWCRHWDDDALDAQAEQQSRAQALLYVDGPDSDDGEPCANYESALHLAVKRILAESREMQLPALEARVERGAGTPGHWLREWKTDAWRATFTDVRLEQRLGRSVPDVVADGSDGTIYIEVTVANPLDSVREERYEALGAAVLEIDLRMFSGRVSHEELRTIVVDGLRGKRWVYHPRQEAERKQLLDAYEFEVLRFKRMALGDLVDLARAHALAYYEANFDASLQAPMLDALRDLERRGFTGASSNEIYGHVGLLPRLLSFKLGRPVGYRVDSVFQVVNAITQSHNPQWAPLYLTALKTFDTPMSEKQRAWVATWRDQIAERVRANDAAVNVPAQFDRVIGLFFPDLVVPISKLRHRRVAQRAPHSEVSVPPTARDAGDRPDSQATVHPLSDDAALALASGNAAATGQSPAAFARRYASTRGLAAADVLQRLRAIGILTDRDTWE